MKDRRRKCAQNKNTPTTDSATTRNNSAALFSFHFMIITIGHYDNYGRTSARGIGFRRNAAVIVGRAYWPIKGIVAVHVRFIRIAHTLFHHENGLHFTNLWTKIEYVRRRYVIFPSFLPSSGQSVNNSKNKSKLNFSSCRCENIT